MTPKWVAWGPLKVSLRPRTRFDVTKVTPKWICAVPTKHFRRYFHWIFMSLETKIAPKNEVGFQCVFWIQLEWKIDWFWYQIRIKLRWYFNISCWMCKVYFWTTVLLFLGILVFSKTFHSLVLQAKINLKTKLDRDLHFSLIFDRFCHQKLRSLSSWVLR